MDVTNSHQFWVSHAKELNKVKMALQIQRGVSTRWAVHFLSISPEMLIGHFPNLTLSEPTIISERIFYFHSMHFNLKVSFFGEMNLLNSFHK